MKEKFIKFLKANNIYEEFCENVVKDYLHKKRIPYLFNDITESQKNAIIEEFFCKTSAMEYMASAFLWVRTEQGFKFWRDMKDEWFNIWKKATHYEL